MTYKTITLQVRPMKRVLWVGDPFELLAAVPHGIQPKILRQSGFSRAIWNDWDVFFFPVWVERSELQGFQFELAYWPDGLPSEIEEEIILRLQVSDGERIILEEVK